MATALGMLADTIQQMREQQMRKAQEVARQSAEKWEQTFRTTQAKQQATDRAHEFLIEEMRAKETERKDREAEDARKRTEAIQKFRIATIWDVAAGKFNQNSVKDRLDRLEKAKTQFQKDFPLKTPAEIQDMAQESVALSLAALTPPEPTSAQPPGMQMSGAEQPHVPTGQGPQSPGQQPAGPPHLQQLLQGGAAFGTGYGIQRPGELPSGMNEAPTALVQKTELMAAQTAHQQATAKHITELTEADKEFRLAQTNLGKVRANEIIAAGKRAAQMQAPKIAEMQAHTAALIAQAEVARRNVDLREQEVNLKRIEVDLKSASSKASGVTDTLKQLKEWQAEVDRTGAETAKLVEDMAKHEEIRVMLPGSDKPPAEKRALMDAESRLAIGLGNRLRELRVQNNNARAQYEKYRKLATDNNIIVPTNRNGSPDPRAASANRRAVSADAQRAAKRAESKAGIKPFAPKRVIPKGAVLTPEMMRQGLPPRRATAPKPLHERSTQDLWDALKH